MRLSTLRSISKINSNVLQNSCRHFSFKFEMTPAGRISQDNAEENHLEMEDQQNLRYNVCQPRTTPVDKPTMSDVTQRHTVKAAIEQQQLQPSMLPEYYQKQMERSALVDAEPDFTEESRINNGLIPINQRRFQVSKTCANATLPLKSVKLASPFPEPVKMMMSRTVSDDEKAEQMLADARSQKTFPEWGKIQSQNGPFRGFSTETRRWYSNSSSSKKSSGSTVGTDSDKCKKLKKPVAQKGACPQIILHNCPPRARFKCERAAQHLDCKKQEAPYPAYSEFCHEELDEKPSECKLCPWKPEDNPNFKPQKKKMHTSAALRLKRSGLELDWDDYSRRLGEDAVVVQAEQVAEVADKVAEVPEGMQCDLRKPPCDRPKNKRCPPTEKEKRDQKEKDKKKKPKEECAGLAEILNEEPLPESIIRKRYENVMSLKDKDKKKDNPHGNCKIRKFKFPDCNEPRKKKIEKAKIEDGCVTRKKKKRRIVDCPGGEGDEQKCQELDIAEEYALSGGKKQKPDKVKCPKIDLTINKPKVEEGEDENPCAPKKKGTTKICPGDLLKKKRRKPKKTSGVFTPGEQKKSEPPQPITRV